jgi:hypothetical protein
MTPAADAALSHISWQRSPSAIPVEICRRKIQRLLRPKLALAAFADQDICSAFRRMAVMSYPQERHGSLAISINRITCSNLVLTVDDFVFQYFQVILRLIDR